MKGSKETLRTQKKSLSTRKESPRATKKPIRTRKKKKCTAGKLLLPLKSSVKIKPNWMAYKRSAPYVHLQQVGRGTHEKSEEIES